MRTIKINSLLSSITTLGNIGYTFAPGTKATILTLPIIYLINYFKIHLFFYSFLLILFFFFSFYAINKALIKFKKKDPSQIVIDEILGCLITFYNISTNFFLLIIGFLFFRFFDIFKPFGLKKIEKLPGAYGILLDDIVAGLLSNLLLRLII